MNALHRNDPDASKAMQRNASVPPERPEPNGAKAPGKEERFDALLALVATPVFTIGPDHRVRRVNEAAQALTGVTEADAVGKPCREVFECAFCGEQCAAVQAERHGELRRDCRIDFHRPDGTTLTLKADAAPLGDGEIALSLRDVSESVRAHHVPRERALFHGLAGESEAMRRVVAQVREVAPFDSTVLILGESGTGKELVARAIHAESPRAAHPFVTVNASAYSDTLLESELFGHVRGAFTGADRDRPGRFELAGGGTVFLDELGDVSPKIQVKLLRVLQEREVERVGESRPRRVDVRVVAATHRDLHEDVKAGRFREDLYYRLNVVTIRLPALRDRREDIPVLADVLLQRAAMRTGKEVVALAEDAMARLHAHDWPGNVRELENVLESAVVRSREGVVRAADLPFDGGDASAAPAPVERLRDALRRAAGNVTLAAKLLDVHRTTLWRWMAEAGIERDDFRP